MSKHDLLILSSVSLAALLLGFFVPTTSLVVTSNIPQIVLTVGGALFLVGCLVGLVVWVGGLIKTAAIGQWGWFVTIVLFNVLGALIYALRGPETAQVG